MDPYFKKQIRYSFKGKSFVFEVAHTLFSTFEIDKGTDNLIRYIIESQRSPQSILDIGCGYGPIGIVLSTFYPDAAVTMLDRDLLAIRYTQTNIRLNERPNCVAMGSVGTEVVGDKKFELIVSNIPAKVGDVALEQDFLLEPVRHLADSGEYWVVIVSALNRILPKLARKHNLSLVEIKRRPGHIIYKIKPKV